MATPDLPTRELGTPGNLLPLATTGYALESGETNTDLRFPFAALIWDRMRREDGRVGSSFRAVCSPILSSRARLVGDDVDPEVLALVETELGLTDPDDGQARRRRQGIVFTEHVRHALLMLAHGFMAFEQVAEVGPASPAMLARFPAVKAREFVHLRKLGPRLPRTIEEVRVARDGGLAGIVQTVTDTTQNSGGRPGTVLIPVDRLVWYCHDREGADWTGNSILRPAYKHWLTKDHLIRLDAQIAERNGMGIPVVTYDPEQPGARQAAEQVAADFRGGARAGMALPVGQTVQLVGVTGTTVDVLPKIAYHDQAAAEALMAHVLTLGHDNGARSLGETLGDYLRDFTAGVMRNIEDTVTEHVIRDLVEWNYGPDAAYPSLRFDPITDDATADTLKTLTDAGVITADRELEDHQRARYGLPAKPAPADGTAVEDAAGSPVADVGIPALITAGVITPSEGRQMLRLPGAAPGLPGPATPVAPAAAAPGTTLAEQPAGGSPSDDLTARLAALTERVLALRAG